MLTSCYNTMKPKPVDLCIPPLRFILFRAPYHDASLLLPEMHTIERESPWVIVVTHPFQYNTSVPPQMTQYNGAKVRGPVFPTTSFLLLSALSTMHLQSIIGSALPFHHSITFTDANYYTNIPSFLSKKQTILGSIISPFLPS